MKLENIAQATYLFDQKELMEQKIPETEEGWIPHSVQFKGGNGLVLLSFDSDNNEVTQKMIENLYDHIIQKYQEKLEEINAKIKSL